MRGNNPDLLFSDHDAQGYASATVTAHTARWFTPAALVALVMATAVAVTRAEEDSTTDATAAARLGQLRSPGD